jgi:translation initiation factor IF-2
MAKVRVFEAAKDQEIDVQELLGALKQLGVKVRSHLSPVEADEIARAVKLLGKKAPAKKKPEEKAEEADKAPKMLVRRRKKDEVVEEPEAEADTEAVAEEQPEETTAPSQAPDATKEAAATKADEAVEATAQEPASEEKPKKALLKKKAPNKEVSKGEVAAKDAEKAKEPKEAKDDKEAKGADEKKPGGPVKAEDGKNSVGLKVVRFIAPEERPTTFVPPPSYNLSKNEREARRADRKARKKKGRRVERIDPRRVTQKTKITVPKAIKRRIKISDIITVAELAKRMGVKSTELIKSLMGLGILTTINQTIDAETATLVADEFGFEIENVAMNEDEILKQEDDNPEDLAPRPPVVTVMGHVDHGKTSLLDVIRKTRVAEGEAGGITQHIGAYHVQTSRGDLVFLDTPGHEAFTEMRARGAKVTDIVVLVVAANDGVMPQTIEAIHHAEAAGVPIIVAINKMDMPDASPDKVKRELAENNLVPEDWGGEAICVPVSAKKGEGIEELLEMIALQAEMMELRANPKKAAVGIVIEGRLDRGRGPVATVLVQGGTINLGDIVLSGTNFGRVRTLTNDSGKRIKQATPGMPVEIAGLDGVAQAGDIFTVVETERLAKEISSRRLQKSRETEMVHTRALSLDDLSEAIAEGEIKSLRLIVKADMQGSVEALSQALQKLSTDAVEVNVIHKGVGGITESNVNLAIASNAIIIGFHVRAESKAAAKAGQSGVDIRLYDVIYDATDDVKKAMVGLLPPTIKESALGTAEVRQTFRAPKVGTIAGCMVTKGIVNRSAKLRLIRDNIVIYDGELSSLKRFKDDAREVREGFECGLSVKDYNDIKVGDELEFYKLEEVAAEL